MCNLLEVSTIKSILNVSVFVFLFEKVKGTSARQNSKTGHTLHTKFLMTYINNNNNNNNK
ncbi:hypothetical protein DFA_01780 [Cavenderia fasciculata]|uniref:Uncharacterized protein n=1 Tax=Cavenderia fasciculata TaxID=261658 RepID=F4PUN0_CACFS|nr:uncharacterized protein DFA_01780 [Cavenderia fasciculata]EGG21894.1 hypothetical protein DFA_01780 [Cavenderia fasciculata]|eukprot:XP_004359745.1 hypothetical protein DFA_01780 [Cavenderia fasciculata]